MGFIKMLKPVSFGMGFQPALVRPIHEKRQSFSCRRNPGGKAFRRRKDLEDSANEDFDTNEFIAFLGIEDRERFLMCY